MDANKHKYFMLQILKDVFSDAELVDSLAYIFQSVPNYCRGVMQYFSQNLCILPRGMPLFTLDPVRADLQSARN